MSSDSRHQCQSQRARAVRRALIGSFSGGGAQRDDRKVSASLDVIDAQLQPAHPARRLPRPGSLQWVASARLDRLLLTRRRTTIAHLGWRATAEPLVRTIYQTGAFGEESVERTVLVTRFLALALIPISLAKLQVRCFHAHRDQSTPMRWSLVQVALNLVLNLILVHTVLREAGLALATAISSAVACLVYAVLLWHRGAGSSWSPGLLRPAIASVLMGAACWCVLHIWPQPEGRGSGAAALRLAAVVGVGMVTYLALAGLSGLRRRRPASAA